MLKTAVKISFLNLFLIFFCLPLAVLINGANYGLLFGPWLLWGGVFAFIAVTAGHMLYVFRIQQVFCKRELLVLEGEELERMAQNRRAVPKITAVSLAIALALGIGLIFLNTIGYDRFVKKEIFESCEDFKAYMENQYDDWFREGYTYDDQNGNYVTETQEDEPNKVYAQIKSSDGNLICEYYCNPELYVDIIFTESAEDRMPVTVITKEAYYNGLDLHQTLCSVLSVLMILDLIIAAGFYWRKLYSKKTKV